MPEQRERLVGEIIFCLILLSFSLFLLWAAYNISQFSSFASAGSFPMAAAFVMVVSGIVILFQTLRHPPASNDEGGSVLRRFMIQVIPKTIVATVMLIVAYMLVLEWLGFLLASFLFLYAAMAVLGSDRWVMNVIISAASLALIYLVFQTAFKVVLPSGTVWQGAFQ